jgi:fructose-bisphosphate aldolase class II
MKTLREYIKEAGEKGVALGHFNISDLEMLHGIVNAARKLGVPVIIGAAEGERKYMGTKTIAAMVKELRDEYDYPIFLNADHTYSFELVKECIDAGYDSVIFDGTKLPYDENVKITKQCVDYARSVNPEIIVEGELGFIGEGSSVRAELPPGVKVTEEFLTKPEEAKDFIAKTGIDMLAPAVGNIHGMIKGGDPNLNIKRVEEIKKAVQIPLVLHGASGNTAEDIKASIKAGINEVHVSTEIRVAFRKTLEDEMKEKPEEVAPYKYMDKTIDAVEKVVEEKLRIFNNL